ncbi:MAG: DUF6544 family protein [Gemmatimonadales bacterium]
MSIQRFKSGLVATLLQEVRQAPAGRVAFDALVGLPAPVTRYLKQVLKDGQPLIRLARVKQTGKLRAGTRSMRWLQFEADQVVAPLTVGFIWDAKVTILGPLHLRVLDAYAGGRGFGRVSLLSAFTLAGDSGRKELNSGALHRYLAEAVWYPTALLPSGALRWSPVDGTKALATLSHAGQTVALEFWFNEAGQVSGVYSPGRWQKVAGGYRQTPWECHVSNYREQDGMQVPASAEVGWHAEGQWQKIWTGDVVDSSYDFAR